MRLVIASANPHKVAEIAEVLNTVLSEGEIEVVAWSQVAPAGVAEVVEDGATLEDNARLKAEACFAATGEPSVADDTGLEVVALDGAPGVRSARYASTSGERPSDGANRRKLLNALKHQPERRARFRTVVVLKLDDETELVAEGNVEGKIATAEAGAGGFGYDALFVPNEGDGRTFAQMSSAAKHSISHRGRALRALAEALRKRR